MKFDYIIVQAGGKGSRMDYLTRNKPKALVPVKNRPLLFHLFEKYPKKKFLIIADYKHEVLEKYLSAFAGKYSYEVIVATGHKGAGSGISDAVSKIPDDKAFMLIWSDLMLSQDFTAESLTDDDYVALSGDFMCRWKYENSEFTEEPSETNGVAGMFIFQNKELLSDVPSDGEFVRWLSERNIKPAEITLHGTKEYGLLSVYQKLQPAKCRPFNQIEYRDGLIIKTGIDDKGRELAVRESAWYRKVQNLGFTGIPEIKEYDPLVMECIDGKNLYEYGNLSHDEKCRILAGIISKLKKLHSYESCPFDADSFHEAYIGKTFDRLKQIQELVPFANREYITVNGRKCRNIFYCREQLTELMNSFAPEKFVLIHGDCTFSNMLLRNETMSAVFIDPRGYFGKTELYGDPAYDWAKLYYSIAGNYDMFNLKRFSLNITDDEATLDIESSGWEDTEEEFFRIIGDEVSERQIRLIHAIIWFSLTTYAWEDYDSICGAFYKGTLLLENLL